MATGNAVKHRPVVGAHDVAQDILFAVARVAGVLSVLWSLIAGLWILHYGALIFDNPSWTRLMLFVHDYRVIGATIFSGGVLGAAGLVFRLRTLSIASGVIGAAWSIWVGSFLLFAHFTGYENFACLWGLGGGGVFFLRIWLLAVVPQQGEQRGVGW